MKKFTKVLAVALAVLMLMMTSVTAFADYWSMPTDEWVAVDAPKNGEEVWVFVPEYSSCYRITTYITDEDSDADPVIYVEDAYGNGIAYCDDYWEDGDREAIVEFYGYEGEEYYIYFSDAGNKKSSYEALVYANCYDDYGDGYCDNCYDRLCYHKCHDGGFFWRIANFFNMLFRINEYCECGAYHW